jgi:BioY family protein
VGPSFLLGDRRDADRQRPIYVFGLPWLAVVLHTGLEKTLEDGLFPFEPGDTFKLYLAAAALPGAWRLFGRFRAWSSVPAGGARRIGR